MADSFQFSIICSFRRFQQHIRISAGKLNQVWLKAASKARDEWLALRCQSGIDGALDDLVSEFERPLFYCAVTLSGNHGAAIDVLQEVWIRAVQGIGKLKEPSSVRGCSTNWFMELLLTASAGSDQVSKRNTFIRVFSTGL